VDLETQLKRLEEETARLNADMKMEREAYDRDTQAAS